MHRGRRRSRATPVARPPRTGPGIDSRRIESWRHTRFSAAIGLLAGGIGLEVVGPVLLAAAIALVVIHGRLETRTAEGTFPRSEGVSE
jgi:hypothetical protein